LLKNRELFGKWIAEYGADKIILGADANNEKSSCFRMVRRFRFDSFLFKTIKTNKGIQYVICTDIAKDGMLEGPSFDFMQRF
jgi:phosphoribosylformimino-5-aminoimidazole carboxamide ribotide isomerase